jgi:DNA modification methylase
VKSSETFLDGRVTMHPGDCLDVLARLDECSVDSVVCDPPYHLTSIVKRFGKAAGNFGNGMGSGWKPEDGGLGGAFARTSRGFMGKQWDGGDVAFRVETWTAVLRVLKPGGHCVAFSGTRTYHDMATAIAGAGFEIRDQLAWIYGSGFPKSHNIGDGWGTALKPAFEPVCFAQKPYTPSQFLASLVPTTWELLCGVASFGKTDTPLFGLLRTSGFLSIAPSLSGSLAALSGHESKCTIETAAALTTELKTLKSSLSRIMHAITTGDTNQTSGVESDVWVAAAISRSAQANFEKLTNTIAGEIAIDWLARPDEGPEASRLSPNWEPICLARKPLIGTVAANVQAHGTGAINVDACRVHIADRAAYENNAAGRLERLKGSDQNVYSGAITHNGKPAEGRWPANIIHDGSEEVVAAFPETHSAGALTDGTAGATPSNWNGNVFQHGGRGMRHGDASGSAARFFYTAKADSYDRIGSKHPTVKPVDLMQWLVRLVTPKGGLVLDPFAGTGTTGEAAFREGMRAVLIEREVEYQDDIRRRMKLCLAGPDERARESLKARGKTESAESLPLFVR